MTTRFCYKCLKDLPVESYYPSSIRKRDYVCRDCSVIHGKEWRKNKRKSNDLNTRYSYAKSSAKSNHKPFLLTKEEYRLIASKPCFYCRKRIKDFGGGLDRINNDKSIGYTVDNVLPCCGTCNRIRGNLLTVEEAKVAISAVMNFRKLHK